MSTLYLMRHAHAEDHSAGGLDIERKLSALGQRQAAAASQWLARAQPPPRLILASPARRARQTALAVQKALELPERQVLWERAIYEASPGLLLDLLRRNVATMAEPQTAVLLVGHNPGLETLLRALSAPSDAQPPLAMGTATIAQLQWPTGFNGLSEQGELQALYSPGPG